MPGPRVSILIPTLNERNTLPFLLADLAMLNVSHEIVVADGGSSDDTRELAASRGAVVIATEPGRGTQLAAAARVGSAPVLCVLHADVRLPPRTLAAIDAYAAQPASSAMAFSLAIDGPDRRLAIIAAGANLRSRMLGLPYGDQGLLLTRAMYDTVGGFESIPIMEDVAIARALSRTVGMAISPERVVVSARRWRRVGATKQTLKNITLLIAFVAGVSPARLAPWY